MKKIMILAAVALIIAFVIAGVYALSTNGYPPIFYDNPVGSWK